ncbi:uncharacterized protein CBL_00705 [Carabus blaptoides fortunei]
MADAWPIGSDESTLAHHHIHRRHRRRHYRHCIPTQSFKILESDFWTTTAASSNVYLLGWVRMPPKKVEEPERKPLIGRVGTNLRVGIVGVPNVGKSTFFNVLTKSQAAAENFPFCTINPNENKETELARHLSDYWKCRYISAKSVISEEISSGTKQRISYTANIDCKYDPLTSESAVFAVQEIVEDLLRIKPNQDNLAQAKNTWDANENINVDDIIEIEKEEETHLKDDEINLEDDMDLGPDINIVTSSESSLSAPDAQLEYLFKLFKDPFVIIYIMCDDLDVIKKRTNDQSDVDIDLNKNTDTESSTASSSTVDSSSNENENEIDTTHTNNIGMEIPVNSRKNISSQLYQFHLHVHPIIEKKLLIHDPQYFIKVDGRLPPMKMFNVIRTRIKTLAFQPVLIPQKLWDEDEMGGDFDDDIIGEFEVEKPVSKFHNMNIEQIYYALRNRFTVECMFRWQLSNFAFKCPVALKDGKIKTGDSKLAVQFMNKIYYLSDENSLLKFYRNPRPYLLPIMPNPTGRIWIMGPKLAGKTVVAKCLSILFDCKILNPIDMEENYKKKKFYEYIENVQSKATAVALKILNEERRQMRDEQIENWKTEANDLLKAVCNYDSSMENNNSELNENIESNIDISCIDSYLESELRKMDLPSMAETSLITSLVDDFDKIIQYLPPALMDDTPITDTSHTFVIDYVKNALQQEPKPDIKVTMKEKVNLMKLAIQEIEDIHYGKYKRRGGWIIDGMPPNVEFLTLLGPKYLADDIICLRDDDPDNNFLIAKHAKEDFSFFHDFKSFFVKMGKIAESEKIRNFISSSKIDLLNHAMSKTVIRTLTQVDVTVDRDLIEEDKNKAFAESLVQFNESWLETLNYLRNICDSTPIEINIANKSMYDLLKESITAIEDRYRRTAAIFTEDDRLQEQNDFEEMRKKTNDIHYGEEQKAEDGDVEGLDNFFRENRRLGDSANYCPVAFNHYNVLWKGKENFAAQFENKLYFFSDQESLNKFVIDPSDCLKKNPPDSFPPPRICITGFAGSGKTTLARNLAHNFDYWQNDIPLPNDQVKYVLHTLWFHKPYTDTGFILDNFPHCPSDVSVMTSNYFIPDIIFHFEISQDEVHHRVFPRKFEQWQKEINLMKRVKDTENEEVFNKWQEERYARLCYLANEKREEMKHSKMEENKRIFTTPVDSKMSIKQLETIVEESDMYEEDFFVYDPEQEKLDLEQINVLLDEEMPEPKFNDKWETEQEAKERIEYSIYTSFERDLAYFDSIADLLTKENIDYLSFDTAANGPSKILNQIIILTEKYKFRNKSLFERVYQLSLDVAERLLEQGFFFISKFGRTCPVQVYERNNPIHMYLPAVYQSNIFPVIHRRYIYFLVGKESLDKFKHDPLKYTNNKDYKLPLIPLKILIIGPPKSGKTYLAERLQQEFHLKVISKNKAIRYVQKHMENCVLAQNIETVTRNDWCVTNEMSAKAIEALTLDGKSICQGFVLDGFPSNEAEMRHFIALGIIPHIILDVRANYDKIQECLEAELNWLNSQTSAEKLHNSLASLSANMYIEASTDRFIESFVSLSDREEMVSNTTEVQKTDDVESDFEGSINKVQDSFDGDKIDNIGKRKDNLKVSIQENIEKLGEGLEAESVKLYNETVAGESRKSSTTGFDRVKMQEQIQASSDSESERELISSYSFMTLKYKYNEWKRYSEKFREWLEDLYENVYPIFNKDSKWHLWVQTKDVSFTVWKHFHSYLKHKHFEVAHSMKSLCVSPDEFLVRQSIFRNYCPLCLYYDDSLVFCGKHPNRSCILQFQNDFFYICEIHINMFVKNPLKYVPPENTKLLPEDLPIMSQDFVTQSAYEDGYCIVSFWNNLPNLSIRKGSVNYSLFYKNNFYLFCSGRCMQQFIETPMKYYDKVIHSKNLEPLELGNMQQLPTLGYLEQFVAKFVMKAVLNTELHRPYVPGLTVAQSASINIALFMKRKNPKLFEDILPIYEEASLTFDNRCRKFKDVSSYFKNQPNPFLCLDVYKMNIKSKIDLGNDQLATSDNAEYSKHFCEGTVSGEQTYRSKTSTDSFLCSLANLIFDNINFPSIASGMG